MTTDTEGADLIFSFCSSVDDQHARRGRRRAARKTSRHDPRGAPDQLVHCIPWLFARTERILGRYGTTPSRGSNIELQFHWEREAIGLELVTFNHGVVGSSPTALTKQNQSLSLTLTRVTSQKTAAGKLRQAVAPPLRGRARPELPERRPRHPRRLDCRRRLAIAQSVGDRAQLGVDTIRSLWLLVALLKTIGRAGNETDANRCGFDDWPRPLPRRRVTAPTRTRTRAPATPRAAARSCSRTWPRIRTERSATISVRRVTSIRTPAPSVTALRGTNAMSGPRDIEKHAGVAPAPSRPSKPGPDVHAPIRPAPSPPPSPPPKKG